MLKGNLYSFLKGRKSGGSESAVSVVCDQRALWARLFAVTIVRGDVVINVSRWLQRWGKKGRERTIKRAVACCPLLHYLVCQTSAGNCFFQFSLTR